MKVILKSQSIDIPAGVEVWVKGRVVKVKGPRGSLTRDFRHLPIDLKRVGKSLQAEVWFGKRAQLACIRTCLSHVENMIAGVTKGFLYKMRMVYAHFPINITINNDSNEIEIRNFIGEKIVRTVKISPGVVVKKPEESKDEITVEGIDIDAVSQCAANVQQITRVRDKDIRKFLDGVYVSQSGFLKDD